MNFQEINEFGSSKNNKSAAIVEGRYMLILCIVLTVAWEEGGREITGYKREHHSRGKFCHLEAHHPKDKHAYMTFRESKHH